MCPFLASLGNNSSLLYCSRVMSSIIEETFQHIRSDCGLPTAGRQACNVPVRSTLHVLQHVNDICFRWGDKSTIGFCPVCYDLFSTVLLSLVEWMDHFSPLLKAGIAKDQIGSRCSCANDTEALTIFDFPLKAAVRHCATSNIKNLVFAWMAWYISSLYV
jgi:hypothetical protein